MDTSPMDEAIIEHTHAFRGAFGRACVLAAQALTERRHGKPVHSRDAVALAFSGQGVSVPLRPIRIARKRANAEIAAAKAAFDRAGVPPAKAVKILVSVAREARDAVQGEWQVRIPILNPNP